MADTSKTKRFMSSSMVDLKAELYRKQEELKRQKQSDAPIVRAKKSETGQKKNLWSKQNKGVHNRAQRDLETDEKNEEEDEALVRSRKILEEKSKVYDSITSSSTIPDDDGSEYYLVDFQKKALDAIVEDREAKRKEEEESERQRKEEEAEKEALSKAIPDASCPEEEWVDFVDSLGRDRRCMRKDLNQLMEKDRQLALASSKKKSTSSSPATISDTQPGSVNPQLMSSDMHREMMRQKWESEAQDLLARGQEEIHYSNVRFDEIRSHGVGFFQFSKDHAKREEEMENLQKLRDETKDEHSRREKVKDKRKAMMEARLAKVRQRRKLKDVPDTEGAVGDRSDETAGPKSDEATSEQEAEKKAEEERVADEKRKNYVREWDQEKKKGEGWGAKNYVATRRQERDSDFAPPAAYFDEPLKSRSQTAPRPLSNKDRIQRLKESVSTGLSEETINEPSGNLWNDIKKSGSMSSIPLPSVPGNQPVDMVGHTPSTVPGPFDKTSDYVQQYQHSGYHPSNSQQHLSGQANGSSQNWVSSQHLQNYGERHSTGPQNQSYQESGGQHFTPYYQVEQSNYPPQSWGYVAAMNHSESQSYNGSKTMQQHTLPPCHGHQQWTHPNQTGTPTVQPPLQQPDPQAPSSYAYNAAAVTLPQGTSGKTKTVSQGAHREPPREENLSEPSPPKKPKVPKEFIMDHRWVNNADTSSINPEPGRVPDVVGVPYTPGTYGKYRPLGKASGDGIADGSASDGADESRASKGGQISGGPLIYTQAQLERQRKELEGEEEEESSTTSQDITSPPSDQDADKKLQDFLSSIRAEAS